MSSLYLKFLGHIKTSIWSLRTLGLYPYYLEHGAWAELLQFKFIETIGVMYYILTSVIW